MNFTHRLCAALALAAVGALSALCAKAADPAVGYVYPAGIRAGTTNRFLIGGQALGNVRDVLVSGSGVRLVSLQVVPNFPNPTTLQRKHLRRWLDGCAKGDTAEPPLPDDPHLDEWRSNAWWRVLGTLDAGQRAIVERDLFVPKNALQATPSLRQMLLVTLAADADAAPSARSLWLSGPSGVSAPRPFAVVRDVRLAEPLYVPPHRAAPPASFADVREGGVVLDGRVFPGETDAFRLRLKTGRAYSFAVRARELQPYIGDAVPGFFNPCLTLRNAEGRVVAFADDAARFRPDPCLAYTPPDEGAYTLEIRDVLFRGRADFVYEIAVGDVRPAVCPQADGVVAHPGERTYKSFGIDKPGRYVLDVKARRLGSPLDAVLKLRKTKDGPVLATWDDATNTVFVGAVAQVACDPCGVYSFAECGTYVAEVTDRTGHGGSDFFWNLEVKPATPSFEVYSTRSTLPLRRGGGLPVDFRVVRKNGFDGPVKLVFPPQIHASVTKVAATSDTIRVSLRWKGKPNRSLSPLAEPIMASATVGGKAVTVPVVPCDEYEQAFAWKHLLPAEAFLVRGR